MKSPEENSFLRNSTRSSSLLAGNPGEPQERHRGNSASFWGRGREIGALQRKRARQSTERIDLCRTYGYWLIRQGQVDVTPLLYSLVCDSQRKKVKSRFWQCHDFQRDEDHSVVHGRLAEAVKDGLFMCLRDSDQSVHEAAVRILSKN